MNYWYVARANELFLDIDNVSKSIKHARARLQGAIECGKLDVAYVMQRPSRGKDHLHVIVTLKDDTEYGRQNPHILFGDSIAWKVQKQVWEIILHGDIYRGCCNIMRVTDGISAPSVLISPHRGFKVTKRSGNMNIPLLRDADDLCECTDKHNATIMKTCPAAIRLRGEFRNVGFFGKPSKNKCTIWPEL